MKKYLAFIFIFGVTFIVLPYSPLSASDSAIIGFLLGAIVSYYLGYREEFDNLNNQYSESLKLLEQELYDNFIMSLNRIHEVRTDINLCNKVYTDFNKLILIINKKSYKDKIIINKDFYEKLSQIYFIINEGDKILETYSHFHNQKFILNKQNPDNFIEVLEIVSTGNINSIYEMIIIKNIYDLSMSSSLDIPLPIIDYSEHLKTINLSNLNMNTIVKLYIAEQVSKVLFLNRSSIYIDKYVDIFKNSNNKSHDFELYLDKFKNNVNNILSEEIILKKGIHEFLLNGGKTPSNQEGIIYKEIIEFLEDISDTIPGSSLAFLGIARNGDTIDSNNYNRKIVNDVNNRTNLLYNVTKKNWWNEGQNFIDTIGISSPYIDSSSSHVYSILKPITALVKEKIKVIGIIGVDIPIDSVFMKTGLNKHTMIIMNTGDIVFDSAPSIKQIFEKQPNINLVFDKGTLSSIIKNEEGEVNINYKDNSYKVTTKKLFDNQYLLSFND